MTGLFAGLVAHLVEVQFGIAITVTRLYFWTYLALFVVLGYKEIQELEKEDIIAQVPHVRERPRFPFLPLFQDDLLMFGVLFTLGFEFVNNAMLETSVFKMIAAPAKPAAPATPAPTPSPAPPAPSAPAPQH